jgi:hypothetical protein
MEIIITAKTSKKNPTQKELDKTVDLVLDAGELIYKKFKFKECNCRCRVNSTSLILKP